MILSDLCNATNKNVEQNFVDIGTASINPFSKFVLISQIATCLPKQETVRG